MSSTIQPAELGFFSALAASPSLSAAGREMGVSTAAVSKHLAQMERRLGVVLINRTTRRMSLTPEGEALYHRLMKVIHRRNAEIVACLSPAEQAQFDRILSKLVAHARQVADLK